MPTRSMVDPASHQRGIPLDLASNISLEGRHNPLDAVQGLPKLGANEASCAGQYIFTD